jgi:dolichol-phosphate mannosyltransferase
MKLSVIVPVHNEEANIRLFYERSLPVLEGLDGLTSWEIVYVNNGSNDRTAEEVLRLRSSDPRVKLVTLSRNFGYHGALVAGLSSRDSQLYAMVDVDCEDPPELLAKFYESIQGGAQLAYGIRSNRDESRLVTLGRKLFYRLNQWIADSEIVMWMGEFAMMTRQVRDAILLPHTTYPFLRAEMGYVGFRRVGIPYLRAKRVAGRSHYGLGRMTKFAVAGILSSTTFPLRLILYLAAFVAMAFPIACITLQLRLADMAMVATVLCLYYLLVTMPFIALYLARTYKNGVARPVFVVNQAETFLEPVSEEVGCDR